MSTVQASSQANLSFSTGKGDSQPFFSKIVRISRAALANPRALFSLGTHRYTLNRSQQSFCVSAIALLVLPSLRGVGARSTFLTTLNILSPTETTPLLVRSSGDILVGGYANGDGLVTQQNEKGDLEWAYTWGGVYDESVRALTTTSDGGFATGGTTNEMGGGGVDCHFLISKWSSNGTLDWARMYGGAEIEGIWALTSTSDGGIIATGDTGSFGGGDRDIPLTKFWNNGTHAWTKVIAGPNQDWPWALTTATDGEIVLGGVTSSFGAQNGDALIAKWTLGGALSWARTLRGASDEVFQSIAATDDGGLVGAGWTNSVGAGGQDALLAKWWNNGTLAWAKVLGGASNDLGISVTTGANGDIVLVGYTNSSGAGNEDALISLWGNNGSFKWAKTLGGSGADRALGVKTAPNGDIIVGGYTNGSGSQETLLARLNPFGQMFSCTQLRDYAPTVSDVTGSLTAITPSITPQSWTPSIQQPASTNIASFNQASNAQCVPQPPSTITGPTFLQTLEGSYASGLALTPDEGILIASTSSGIGEDVDASLVKWWTNGTLAWVRTLGGANEDNAIAVTTNSQGIILLTGRTSSFGAGNIDAFVARYEPDGTLTWLKTLGGSGVDRAAALITLSNERFVIAGDTSSSGGGLGDFFISGWDINGTVVWTRTTGGISDEQTWKLAASNQGDFVLSGLTYSFGAGGVDAYVVKWDHDGLFLWSKTLGGAFIDQGLGVAILQDQTIMIAGETEGSGLGGRDVLIAKFESNGDLAWARAMGGPLDDRSWSFTATSDGGGVSIGITNSFGAGGYDVLMSKWWANGTLAWATTLGNELDDWGTDLVTMPSGEIMMVGVSLPEGVAANTLFARLTSDGQLFNCSVLENIFPGVRNITGSVTVTTPVAGAQNWNPTIQDWNTANTSATSLIPLELCLPQPPPPPVTTGIATTGQASTTGASTTGTFLSSSPSTQKKKHAATASGSPLSTAILLPIGLGVLGVCVCATSLIGTLCLVMSRRRTTRRAAASTELQTRPATTQRATQQGEVYIIAPPLANSGSAPQPVSEAPRSSYNPAPTSPKPAYTNFENPGKPEGHRSIDLQGSGQSPHGLAGSGHQMQAGVSHLAPPQSAPASSPYGVSAKPGALPPSTPIHAAIPRDSLALRSGALSPTSSTPRSSYNPALASPLPSSVHAAMPAGSLGASSQAAPLPASGAPRSSYNPALASPSVPAPAAEAQREYVPAPQDEQYAFQNTDLAHSGPISERLSGSQQRASGQVYGSSQRVVEASSEDPAPPAADQYAFFH